jgi:chemotaxis protein MotB
MLRITLGIAAIALGSAACHPWKDDFEKAANENRELETKMTQAQAACEKEIGDRDVVIEGLETKVQAMGGDLERVREELGARAEELASTRTELAATEAEVAQLRALRARAEAEKAQFKALTERFQSMIDAGQLEVVRRDGRMMLKLPDDILFPSGSRRLKQDGREALQKVAAVLKDVGGDREFIVAGHTDNVPVKRGGRFASNWELSTARATTVVQLMIDEGVDPDQLAAAGYGEHDPIASNDTAEGRQKNRRLEIILMPRIEAVETE